MPLDPFAGATSVTDEGKKRLLEAVASAGTAGRASYEQAQAAIAAAQQEALSRAAEITRINGFDAGTSAKVATRFGQHQSALANAQDSFTKGLQQTGSSGASYMEKLGATLPLLQEQNRAKTSAREEEIKAAIALAEQKRKEEVQDRLDAENRQIERENRAEGRSIARENRAKAAEFPLKDILGATQLAQPGVNAKADASKVALDTLTKDASTWASGSNLKPLQDEMVKNGKRLDAINQLTKGGVSGGLSTLKSLMPGGQKAIWGNTQIKQLKAEQNKLVSRQSELVKQMDALKAYNSGQNKTSAQRLSQLQAQYADAQKLTDPVALSRYLSENVFGRGANETYGNLTDATWQPILNAVATNDKRGIGEQAKGLADKLKINGGAKAVSDILGSKEVQDWIVQAQALTGGDYTFDQIKTDLANDFLKKGKDRTYAVLEELLHGYAWGKAKK